MTPVCAAGSRAGATRRRRGAGRRRRCRAPGAAPRPGSRVCHAVGRVAAPASSVPDVLAPGLRCVFCGINPGRVSAAAAAHFANPRNDFWRLLHAAGFTPRLLAPAEQFALLDLGYGVTNAAYRTTPGSGDLRRGDFDAGRLDRARARAAAARARLRRQGGLPRLLRRAGRARAAAADARADRRSSSSPRPRPRTLPSPSPSGSSGSARSTTGSSRSRARRSARSSSTATSACSSSASRTRSATRPGGRPRAAGSSRASPTGPRSRRELAEECGLPLDEPGPVVWTREHVFPWNRELLRQHERFHLIRVDRPELRPAVDLTAEGVYGFRWWSLAELADDRRAARTARARDRRRRAPPRRDTGGPARCHRLA